MRFTAKISFYLLTNGFISCDPTSTTGLLKIVPLFDRQKLNIKGFRYDIPGRGTVLDYLEKPLHGQIAEDNIHTGYVNDYSAICNFHMKPGKEKLYEHVSSIFDGDLPALGDTFACLYGFIRLLYLHIQERKEISQRFPILDAYRGFGGLEDREVLRSIGPLLNLMTKLSNSSNSIIDTLITPCLQFINCYSTIFKSNNDVVTEGPFLRHIYYSLTEWSNGQSTK